MEIATLKRPKVAAHAVGYDGPIKEGIGGSRKKGEQVGYRDASHLNIV